MNPTRKKFVSLFLVFSLVMLSVNLYSKERRGAKLIVTKKDGWQIEGELITVKPNSLLLLDTEGKDVSVGIAEIKVIRIVKKSKDLLGAGIGLLMGVWTRSVNWIRNRMGDFRGCTMGGSRRRIGWCANWMFYWYIFRKGSNNPNWRNV